MDCAVKIYPTRTEAELARGLLKANGIRSYILADDAGRMYPQLDRTAGVKLVVARKDRATAEKLFKNRV